MGFLDTLAETVTGVADVITSGITAAADVATSLGVFGVDVGGSAAPVLGSSGLPPVVLGPQGVTAPGGGTIVPAQFDVVPFTGGGLPSVGQPGLDPGGPFGGGLLEGVAPFLFSQLSDADLGRVTTGLFKFSETTGKVTPRSVVPVPKTDGSLTYYRNVGAPILFSGDLALVKRVDKVGRRAARVTRSGRRPGVHTHRRTTTRRRKTTSVTHKHGRDARGRFT